MSRRFAVLAAFAVLSVVAPAANAAPPAPQSLDGAGWQFHEDPANKGLASGWSAGGPSGGWDAVSVPSTFDARPLARLFSGTVGWYRLRFQEPTTPAGYSWALRFDQVRRKSVVWLNGHRLGRHSDPYTPFELPARGLHKGTNELVVRVDSRKGDRPREGWWNWGGILRPVALVPRGRLALRDAAFFPDVHCGGAGCDAWVRLTGAIQNRTDFAVGGVIEVALTAPDGTKTTATVPIAPLAGGRGRVVNKRIAVSGEPALWAPGNPNLYDNDLTVRAGNRVEQQNHSRIGLRT